MKTSFLDQEVYLNKKMVPFIIFISIFAFGPSPSISHEMYYSGSPPNGTPITLVWKWKTADSVPMQNSAFMDVLIQGKPYIFCLAPADSIGENHWDSVTDIIFYLSESGQVVPLKDDQAHCKAMGITQQSFRELIIQANSVK